MLNRPKQSTLPPEEQWMVKLVRQQICHVAQDLNPHGWEQWKDRYHSPSGYEPWNEMAGCHLINSSDRCMRMRLEEKDTFGFWGGMMAATAQLVDPPAIYLKRDLLDSFLKTSVGVMDAPQNPFPAFFLMLPRKMVFGDEGEEITSILVVTEPKLKEVCLSGDNERWNNAYNVWREERGMDGNGLHFSSNSIEGSLFCGYTNWLEGTDWRNLPPAYLHGDASVELLDATDRLALIIKNVILLMNHHYELVSTQMIRPPRSQRGFGVAAANRTRPIYWLGKDFTAKREVATSAEGADGKTYGDMAPHWRRGHWHTYWTGTNRSVKTVKWLEAVRVNWPE